MNKIAKVLLSLVATAALSASALDPANLSFFSGNSGVIVTNNSTVAYGDAGVFYVAPEHVGKWSGQSNNIVPNAYNGAGTRVANDSPTAVTYYFTNTITANGINNLYDNAWKDIPGSSDRNGNTLSANISVTFNGVSAANTTNLVTFVIGRISDGVNVGTTALDKFTFAGALANGTTPVTYSTNVPSSFLQGTTRLRLLSIAANNVSSSSYVVVSNVTLNFFQP